MKSGRGKGSLLQSGRATLAGPPTRNASPFCILCQLSKPKLKLPLYFYVYAWAWLMRAGGSIRRGECEESEWSMGCVGGAEPLPAGKVSIMLI